MEVLGRHTGGQEYFREVAAAPGAERAGGWSLGRLKSCWTSLPEGVRREILRERQPLGRILTESGVEFSSQPRAYLRIASDDFINRALDLDGAPLPLWPPQHAGGPLGTAAGRNRGNPAPA